MSAAAMILEHERIEGRNQFSDDQVTPDASLTAVTGFLDAALQMWDRNPVEAKSQVTAAALMLRGFSDTLPTAGSRAVPQSDTGVLAPWQIRRVKEFINASLPATIRMPDCASQVRLSASYFSCAFKATFGMTVREYIRRRRIERAQQLMLSSEAPQSQIAVACGFADQAHYCRVFRDVMGISPRAWRRRNMALAPDE